jgi:ATP-binding cassette subfamily B protein RaxB
MKLDSLFVRRVPLVLQSEAAECGLACIAMCANYHGYEVDLGTLRAKLSASLRGVTLAQLMQMSSELNLSPRALRLELVALERLRVPSILHWDLDHFVVLEKVAGNKVWIIDPAIGRRVLTLEETSKHFTGVAMEVTPTQRFKAEKARHALSLGDFFRNARLLRPALLKLFGLSVALQVLAILAPFYTQIIIDQVLAARDHDLLTLLALGFGVVAFLHVSISALRSFIVMYFGAHLQFEWATRLFHHLIRLPMSFFEKRHMGDVVSRFRSLQPIQQLVTTTMVEAVIDGLMATTTLVVMLLYSPLLTLLPVVALLIYAVVRAAVYNYQREAAHESLIKSANENTHFLETLRGMLTIKSFSGEHLRESTWQNRLAESVRTNLRTSGISMAEGILNQFLFGMEAILVVWLGALAIMDGGLSVGMLIAFLAYKTQFTSRAAALIDKFMEYRLASVNLDRLSDIALTEQETGLDVVPAQTRPIEGRLELRGISFRYAPTDPLILGNVDLHIAAGECVAVVGPSGCGKTTLMKVMMGLLAPESGEILVDGRSLAEVTLRGYRRSIAGVMQEDCLLSGSLADNIAFFNQKPDMQLVERCARVAAVHDDIVAMPMGYFTQVGDMGAALSGGQKQRVLLARALYAQPQMLFLDEATSHLDLPTEARIHEELKKLEITRVVIAHRNETVAIADRVIRLGGGDPPAPKLAIARG